MLDSISPQQALALAINRMGSQAALARLVGVSQQAVSNWVNDGAELPAEHVLKVEAATRVLRHDLRPDIYPRGLQDGVPFIPQPDLTGDGGLGTDDRQPDLQRPAA